MNTDQILYGRHIRTRTVDPLLGNRLVPGSDFPYYPSVLTSTDNLILAAAPAGSGALNQVRSLIISDDQISDTDKLIVCPVMTRFAWIKDTPDVCSVTQEYLSRHIDRFLETAPKLLIVEEPHGSKTVPLIKKLADCAERTVIKLNDRLAGSIQMSIFPYRRVYPQTIAKSERATFC